MLTMKKDGIFILILPNRIVYQLLKVKLQKIIRAERNKVYETITDFENLPIKLPKYFKSVKIIRKENNVIFTEEFVNMTGRDITQKVKHVLTPPEKHEVFIIEGEVKDSHIIETYESISEGTSIFIDGDFKLSGKLKLVGFLAKGKIENSINEVMDAVAKLIEP